MVFLVIPLSGFQPFCDKIDIPRDTESVAHVLLDRRRKAQEIALGGPHPMQRFLVGSRDTSHFKIIPVLGYSNKCVIAG